MSIKRTITWWLAIGALMTLADSAWGFTLTGAPPPQVYDNRYALGNPPHSEAAPPFGIGEQIQPFGPVGFEMKAQPFAPADISDYGNGPKAKIGFFFNYDRLEWSISRPFTADIGNPDAEGDFTVDGVTVFERNSLDTNFIKSKFAGGNRFEAGYVDTNKTGWMVSVIDHVTQSQSASFTGPQVLFLDTSLTPPETVFGNFTALAVRNRIVLNGVELMRIIRAPQLHKGGELELMYGMRFFQADESFIWGAAGGDLDDAFVISRIQNNIVGPQFAGRWYKQRGRWITSAEGRFMAGASFQNAHLNAFSTTSSRTDYEFSPLGELRLQAAYEITRTVGIQVGYTAIFLGGVSRPSNRIDYVLPNMQFLDSFTNQNLFIQGLTFGFFVNR